MLPRAKDLPDLYPGIAPRFLAMLIDCIPVAAVAWLLVTLAHAAGVYSGYDGYLFWLLAWPYCALFESSRLRATPGKWVCGLEVLDSDGGRIGFGRASGRYFAKFLSCAIFLIGFLMTDFTPRRQALHDYLSVTYVVRRKPFAAWVSAGSPQYPPASVTFRSVGSIVGNVLLLSIVAVFGYLVYRMIANSEELRGFCATVKPGMTREQLQTMVTARHYTENLYKDTQYDSALISIPGTFPPNRCVADFSGDRVVSVRYVPFD